jgi:hypothetical protein
MVLGTALYVVALLAVAIAVAHSISGERFNLVRLFRREDLPQLFGGTDFTMRAVRFASHIPSIACCGFGVILVLLANGEATAQSATTVIAGAFALTAIVPLLASCGRHLSWIVFGPTAGLADAY